MVKGVPGGYRIWDNKVLLSWGDLHELMGSSHLLASFILAGLNERTKMNRNLGWNGGHRAVAQLANEPTTSRNRVDQSVVGEVGKCATESVARCAEALA